MKRILTRAADWVRAQARAVRSVLFTKTMAGALVSAIGYLSDPGVAALLPHKWAVAFKVTGGLLTAVGVRHALEKLSAAKAAP